MAKTRTNQPVEGIVEDVNDAIESGEINIPQPQSLSQILESFFPDNYQGQTMKQSINDFSNLLVIIKENGNYKVVKPSGDSDITIYAYLCSSIYEFPTVQDGYEEIQHIVMSSELLDEQNYLTMIVGSIVDNNHWKVPLEELYQMYT